MALLSYDVLNRWTGEVQFTAQISCNSDTNKSVKLGLAVRWAVKNNADLRGAILSGADLRGAILSGAILSGADLRDAILRDAILRGADLRDAILRDAILRDADLRGADLRGADLRGAILRGADLRDAILSGADLRDAILRGAILSGADLRGADLRDAILSGAILRPFKSCLWMTLTMHPNEAQGVADALREGRVDGSTYSGKCACLVGTIGNIKGVAGESLPHNSSDPSERWFMMISEGDTPDKDTGGGYAAKLALEWVEEWIALRDGYVAGLEAK